MTLRACLQTPKLTDKLRLIRLCQCFMAKMCVQTLQAEFWSCVYFRTCEQPLNLLNIQIPLTRLIVFERAISFPFLYYDMFNVFLQLPFPAR